MKKFLPLLFAFLVAPLLAQDNPDAVVGKYYPPEKDSVIEMFKCGAKYCGRTLCLKNPNYAADAKDGTPGTPYLDDKNSEASLRTRPALGLQFISGFDSVGDSEYKNGKIYNPRDGKTYCGKILLEGNKLNLKGHLCISSFLGKTNVWTKVDGAIPAAWACAK
jgi:uncharacterized protein (DUF2147 family)